MSADAIFCKAPDASPHILSKYNQTSYKIRPYTKNSKCLYVRERRNILGTGDLAAHRSDRLMLLGSPPDMVHRLRSRETHPSTYKTRRADHTETALIFGFHPCCSGLQVQGTAISPAGMALFYSLLKILSVFPTTIYYNRLF